MKNYGKVIDAIVDLIDLLEDEGLNVNDVVLEDISDLLGIPDMMLSAFYYHDDEDKDPF